MSVNIFGTGSMIIHSNKIVRGPPGVGFKKDDNENFDLENKRLTNVGDAVDPCDAVNLKYFNDINNSLNNLQLEMTSALENLSIDVLKDEINNLKRMMI